MASSRRTTRSDRRGPRARGRAARETRSARPPPVRVRPARLPDSPAIARVMRASIRALARGAYRPRQLAAWSSLPALYHAWAMTAGGERYLVAERAGRIVGY